jgi:serine/threonine protein phosphatase PrpC
VPHNKSVKMSACYKLACAHAEMNPRKRNTMEDCHRVTPHFNNNESLAYFGVYDGHGGRNIVDFLEEKLEQNIGIELNMHDDAKVPERLTRAFLITDMQSRKCDITTSGATAVSVLLKREDSGDRTLYVANVGDSRAILCCQPYDTSAYVGMRLTYDHRAEDESEVKRIQEAGGFIARGRVLGILAVSRSFGDHGMKDFVTADPYLSETRLSEYKDCPFLILACDGVWDVMTDQEGVDLILESFRVSGPSDGAARLLVSYILYVFIIILTY